MFPVHNIPLLMLTDSYKICHPFLYPDAKKMVAYGEFRTGYNDDREDTRILFYGIRYVIENYIAVRWTLEDVEKAEIFFKTHNAGYTDFKFPKDLFLKFIEENDGYFPVKIEALPEGTVIYPHVPVYQITAENEYAPLCTFLETVLTMVWYPTTVATLSRRCRDLIESSYERTADPEAHATIDSRLHDFGFRGCTGVEQSIVGGCAHLVNFDGSDTLTAAYYAQFNLNNGKPVASSIPATEHSVMMSFEKERAAILKMMNTYGQGVYAIVMDTYDYVNALEKVLPTVAKVKISQGGFLVIRPDSGDPIEVVLQGLRNAEKVFGSTVNKKGFKVLNGCGVIQGDGVTYDKIRKILAAVEKAGYSAQNVAVGMGGGLLQKLNRDTMSFATKLAHIEYADGTSRDVFKYPKSESCKVSLPGEFCVRREAVNGGGGVPIVYPKEPTEAISDAEVLPIPANATHSGIPEIGVLVPDADAYAAVGFARRKSRDDPSNVLRTVYDWGPIYSGTAKSVGGGGWCSFETVRQRSREQWRVAPKNAQVISGELQKKASESLAKLRKTIEEEEYREN